MIPSRICATLLSLLALPFAAQATEYTYDFTGMTTVTGPRHQFTGVFVYEDGVASSTVYQPGQDVPVQQGFQSTYDGAVRELSIRLDNGETVAAAAGAIDINNIQQAEIGTQVPADLSLQAWTWGAQGTINGLEIFNIYLAFSPVAPNFSWDPLDAYFETNAENLLRDNPALLPAYIDPLLTGTAMPRSLIGTFNAGVFLGTNHGLTNTVNRIDSFTLRAAVPESGTWALMLGGLAGLAALRRKPANRAG